MRGLAALVAHVLVSFSLAACATEALNMAPARPDAPWSPTTGPDGEIAAGERRPPGPDKTTGYVLPSNRNLAAIPRPAAGLERRRPYTLPELIGIAQSKNPVTRNAWNDARNAALAAGIAESSFLPFVSAGIVQGWQKFHNEFSSLGATVSNDVTGQGNVEVLSVQWLLFDFGERAALVDVAKQGSAISNIAFTFAHPQVIYNVSLAFYADAAARAHFATAAKSLRDAEEVQAAAEDRYERGVGTVVEVAQTKQATAHARLMKVQADGAMQNSYLALISAMGISPTTRLAIADISRRRLPPALTAPVERFVSEALARRPDVLTGYARVQASLAGLRAAQAEFFPKVFGSMTGTRLSGSLNITAIPGIDQQLPIVNLPNIQPGLSTTQLGSTALLGATVPLYDGGSRAAVVEQARDKVDQAETTLTQIRNDAAQQIITARNTLKTSLSAYAAATALAAAAQTTFNAAKTAYRNGVGSITDATSAERQLLEANNAATDAYSAALSSAATLALAAGALGTGPPR
ncbi:MAG: TolC family protein [Bradyrhizobium sp.]|nr:TolC family protein [Bradyrhizobium sp.]